MGKRVTILDVPGRIRIVGRRRPRPGRVRQPAAHDDLHRPAGIASNTLDIAETLATADFAPIAPIHRNVRSELLWRLGLT